MMIQPVARYLDAQNKYLYLTEKKNMYLPTCPLFVKNANLARSDLIKQNTSFVF